MLLQSFKIITHIAILCRLAVSTARRPVIISKSNTPNANTSVFSSTIPCIKYSGARYLVRTTKGTKPGLRFKHQEDVVFKQNARKYNSPKCTSYLHSTMWNYINKKKPIQHKKKRLSTFWLMSSNITLMNMHVSSCVQQQRGIIRHALHGTL